MSDILKTMEAELIEAMDLMRVHESGDIDDTTLRRYAESARPQRYAQGRWPDFAAAAAERLAERRKEEMALRNSEVCSELETEDLEGSSGRATAKDLTFAI